MIFEQVENSTLKYLRLVSRQFKDLTTPIKYRHVNMTRRLAGCFAQGDTRDYLRPVRLSGRQVARDVSQYTEHVSVNQSVIVVLALRLLKSLKNLRHIT